MISLFRSWPEFQYYVPRNYSRKNSHKFSHELIHLFLVINILVNLATNLKELSRLAIQLANTHISRGKCYGYLIIMMIN